MSVEIVFITHSTSEDNEAGLASGWHDSPLSAAGEAQAVAVRGRWGATALDAVYASDLSRARRTAEVGFAARVSVYLDARLREVGYGLLTRRPRAEIDAPRATRVHTPHPDGESYVEAARRHREAYEEIARAHPGGTVLVVGHYATWMALEHLAGGRTLEDVAAEVREWQPGWRYTYD